MKHPEPAWVSIFLDTLRETGTIAAACRKAGVDSAMPYRRAKQHPEFKAAWDAVMTELEEKPHQGPRHIQGEQPWYAVFLEALRAGQTVKQAAATAGMSDVAAYKHRRRFPQFRADWDAIVQERPEPAWVSIFLDTLRETGIIAAACEKAGISTAMPFRRAKQHPEFKAAWDAVMAEFEQKPYQGPRRKRSD